jgi:hypothetical protein
MMKAERELRIHSQLHCMRVLESKHSNQKTIARAVEF